MTDFPYDRLCAYLPIYVSSFYILSIETELVKPFFFLCSPELVKSLKVNTIR